LKHAIIGTLLIFAALFLTPCYIEPSDIVISGGWIAFSYATFPDWAPVILPIWMAVGYICFILGAILLGGYLLRRLGVVGLMVLRHPIMIAILIFVIALTVTSIVWNYYPAGG
jgi:hypothetical protein